MEQYKKEFIELCGEVSKNKVKRSNLDESVRY